MANIEQKFREACKQSGLASILNQLDNPALNTLVQATMNILKQKLAGNQVVGFISFIGKTTDVSKNGNPFNKREIVLDMSRYDPETGEKRENYVSMNFIGRHCEDLDGFNVGDKVEVTFYVGGNKWQDKVINDIVGYRIERIGQQSISQPQPQQPAPAPQQPQFAPQPQQPVQQYEEMPQQEGSDDLPF